MEGLLRAFFLGGGGGGGVYTTILRHSCPIKTDIATNCNTTTNCPLVGKHALVEELFSI